MAYVSASLFGSYVLVKSDFIFAPIEREHNLMRICTYFEQYKFARSLILQKTVCLIFLLIEDLIKDYSYNLFIHQSFC